MKNIPAAWYELVTSDDDRVHHPEANGAMLIWSEAMIQAQGGLDDLPDVQVHMMKYPDGATDVGSMEVLMPASQEGRELAAWILSWIGEAEDWLGFVALAGERMKPLNESPHV